MLVNQMQRDLQSSHILEICGGLLATTNIITGRQWRSFQAH